MMRPGLIALFLIYLYLPYLYGGQLEDFLSAKNAFDNGSYNEAISRFRELLESDPPKLTSRHLRIEAHQYLGAAFIITGKFEEGKEQFEELLAIDPEFQMEPSLFPTSVLDIFNEVKKKVMERREKVRELEMDYNTSKCDERVKNLKQRVETKIIERNSRWFSFLPFGIAQFQNNQFIKGYLFLIFESLFLSIGIITWGIMQYLPKVEYCPLEYTTKQCEDIEESSRILTYTNWGALSLFLATVIWGMIDGFVNYKAEVIIKNEVRYLPYEEDEVRNRNKR